ncbi:MAG: hypothetical protein ACRDHX_01470 [Chloroflexota bacterium]
MARVLIRVVVLTGGVGGVFGKLAVMLWFILAAALFLASQPHLDPTAAELALVIAVGGYWSTKGVCWPLLQLPPFVVFRRWWGASQFMGVLALVGLILQVVIARR